ncbi:MAG TPA: helix-turn-helix transcriptional regulator [Stellaceae bacterium]|jgi:DNA-binding transcriptional ArsR family regulator|nr:helix-turn-helix transcriptional regulator [Stellaceae bacterium]
MPTTSALAETAALIGEPARAGMLLALMDGRALTAGELARVAGVTPQTASGHLGRLAAAGLLSVHCQGRHHYHRLASASVARMLESLMAVSESAAAQPRRAVVTGPRDRAMRAARTCYDHLAGQLGVTLADSLVERGHIELSSEGGAVTNAGLAFFGEFGLDLAAAPRSGKRLFCRPCLDWSERRLHVGGMLGAALADRCFALNWIRRAEGSRTVVVTPAGELGFRASFGF